MSRNLFTEFVNNTHIKIVQKIYLKQLNLQLSEEINKVGQRYQCLVLGVFNMLSHLAYIFFMETLTRQVTAGCRLVVSFCIPRLVIFFLFSVNGPRSETKLFAS